MGWPHRLSIDVRNCARCGGDHDGLDCKRFARPPGEWTFWGTCPDSGDPVLVRITEDESEPAQVTE
jgi:hypothetical protein